MCDSEVSCREEEVFGWARTVGEFGEEEGAGFFALGGLDRGFGFGFIAAVAGAGTADEREDSQKQGFEPGVVWGFGELFDNFV